MRIVLPQLPYPYDALEPHISRTTLERHHAKHHRAYVDKAKALAKEVRLADRPLEFILQQTAGQPVHQALFNNAAQAWNHAFFWRSLMPQAGGAPQGPLLNRLERDFGSYQDFAEKFQAAAAGHFGSGWAWLVLDSDNRLRITTTANADTPLVQSQTPLLAIDVWEHAYYLDYQNRRDVYVRAIFQNLLNWDFAAQNLGRQRSAPPASGDDQGGLALWT